MDKLTVSQLLTKAGDFLVRESTKKSGEQVLCLRLADGGEDPIFSVMVEKGPSGYNLKGHTSVMQPTVGELLRHYQDSGAQLIKGHALRNPVAPAAEETDPEDDYVHTKSLYDLLPATSITIDVTDEIGKGNFGQVYGGTANGIPAAIKVVRVKEPKLGVPVDPPHVQEANLEAAMLDLRKEIALMQLILRFGQHPNLIKVLAYDDGDDPKLALERCNNGSILSMVRAHLAVSHFHRGHALHLVGSCIRHYVDVCPYELLLLRMGGK
jgi:hypothetical protein